MKKKFSSLYSYRRRKQEKECKVAKKEKLNFIYNKKFGFILYESCFLVSLLLGDEFRNCGVTPKVDEAYLQRMLILIGKH